MMPDRLVTHYRRFRSWMQGGEAHDRTHELLGAILAEKVSQRPLISSLHEVEFRVFSQWGDDGIIQWLVSRMPNLPKRFVEFGVDDYSESNTRFLMVHDNWSGLVMDGSSAKLERLRQRKWFWRYNLTAVSHFLTRENVDQLIIDWAGEDDIGLLHIDVDGNDFWLWDAIHSITPFVVIVEYNALFGADRTITVPYRPDFRRHAAHYSGQYAGASLAALTDLAERKGYALIGSNSAGNNAYFVHESQLNDEIRRVTVDSAFVQSNFRDSRDRFHRISYLSYQQRQDLIRGLPVFNVVTGAVEPF